MECRDAPAERPRPAREQALSRSRVALDQNSTMIAVVELSQSGWLVAGVLPGTECQPRKKLEPNAEGLLGLLLSSGAPPNVTDTDLRVAAGFLGHLAEARHELLGAAGTGARRRREYPVAITDRAPRGEAEGAADDYRRMRLLRRLGPGHHRRKADELAVMFRLVLGPDLLHRRDLLAHLLRT